LLSGIADNLIADHRRAERRRLEMLQRLAENTATIFSAED
jgi:hypothetical protein